MLIDLPIKLIELEDSSYHIIIETHFLDSITGNLIIDTGASKTVFDSNFVSPFIKSVKKIEGTESSGINAMITETKIGIIPVISFGSVKLIDFKCLLLDLSHINQLYAKVADIQISGLIGSDFLVHYEAVINFHQKKLTLNISND